MVVKKPTFLKRQKELKRTARALEKREARRARKVARSTTERVISSSSDQPVEGTEQVQDPEP